MTDKNAVDVIPVVLCGGSGSRLWPVSRELHPKPFIRLSDGQSFLQKAYLRSAQLPGVGHIISVVNRELFFKAEDDFREVVSAQTSASFVLEPCGRNTAPAIAAAALHVQQMYGADAILLILAADHLIANQQAFEGAVMQAVGLAQQGKIVTFGIQPKTPETGYGYIEFKGNEVLRFIEKPSLEKAQEYLAQGNFLWNAGIFCFSVKTILEQMEYCCPDLLVSVRDCVKNSRLATSAGFNQLELKADYFANVPDISIDYAVMEKSKQVAVVSCDIGWSDIGSWVSLGELYASDISGHRVQGEIISHNAHDCIIQAEGKMVGLVGVNDLVVVDTPDALLVANKSQAQNVKNIYNELKNKKLDVYKLHRTVHRPWGTYTVLEEGVRFKIKRIVVKPGASLSLQMHHHRSEHWVVVSGVARVVNGEDEVDLNVNQSTFIPAKHLHRLHNPGQEPCVLIEVQVGDYLGEDDIVRFQDNYGRA